jgi:hypothetical protein
MYKFLLGLAVSAGVYSILKVDLILGITLIFFVLYVGLLFIRESQINKEK